MPENPNTQTEKNSGQYEIIIKNREYASFTGVNEVESFTDAYVQMDTTGVGLTVEGENIKIEKFSTETGALVLTGKIFSVYYYGEDSGKKKGLFRRR